MVLTWFALATYNFICANLTWMGYRCTTSDFLLQFSAPKPSFFVSMHQNPLIFHENEPTLERWFSETTERISIVYGALESPWFGVQPFACQNHSIFQLRSEARSFHSSLRKIEAWRCEPPYIGSCTNRWSNTTHDDPDFSRSFTCWYEYFSEGALCHEVNYA